MKYILYLIIVLVVGVIFFTLTVFGVRTLYKRTMTKQAAKNYQKYLDNSEMENGKRFLSRDSLLVVYYMTSLEKHSIGKEWQNSSPMIQDIFYSPDSLKMIAFGILKDIDKEGISIPNNRIRVFAGIRKSKREIWKVHRITNLAEDTEMQEEAHLKTGDVTRKLKYKYFTYNIRKSSVKVYNDKLKFAGKVRKKTDDYRIISYQYCLPDPRFWDDLTFIEDNKLKGLYDFQVMKTDGRYQEIHQNWFVVPDSIRVMYE